MSLPQGLNMGLGSLPLLSSAQTRSISAENPDGSKGGGAKAVPADDKNSASLLGKGWKVRPCISIAPETTITLADIQGPGIIQHIWITTAETAYRDCILRFYWDGEATPSIEVPLGDFFACGHGMGAKVNSLAVAVNPKNGLNCYWPMPFRKGARITLTNERPEEIRAFFYQIDYALTEVPADAAYLHAQFRRGITPLDRPEHVILDGVRGQGHYVGTYLAWKQTTNGWWGEGEIKFFLDGDGEYPTICGTGTEDYVCGAWCFGETFTGPYSGYCLWDKQEGSVPRHGLYRWHLLDPIRFQRDLRITIQALGYGEDAKYYALNDDISSVALWYQAEPHAAFPAMPERRDRFGR